MPAASTNCARHSARYIAEDGGVSALRASAPAASTIDLF
jgi:hypothetical protein